MQVIRLYILMGLGLPGHSFKSGFRMSLSKPVLPSFELPPVIEVVVSVQFESPLNVRSIDIADLWSAFGKEKFEVQELPPLEPILTPNVLKFEFTQEPHLPRYLFRHVDKSCLLQFQKDRFVFNWTKPMESPADCYPRYRVVLKNFLYHYEVLKSFLNSKKRDLPKPSVMSLTYINLLDHPDDLAKLGEIFKDFNWHQGKRFLPAPRRISHSFDFKIDEKILFNSNISTVQLVADGRNMLKYELTVKGPIREQNESGMVEFLDKAREWIVSGFDDQTTEKMHKLWRKV